MSSMFKKRAGLAFKPKAPVARPRPSAAAPSASAPKLADSQLPLESTLDTVSKVVYDESGSFHRSETASLAESLPVAADRQPASQAVSELAPSTAVPEASCNDPSHVPRDGHRSEILPLVETQPATADVQPASQTVLELAPVTAGQAASPKARSRQHLFMRLISPETENFNKQNTYIFEENTALQIDPGLRTTTSSEAPTTRSIEPTTTVTASSSTLSSFISQPGSPLEGLFPPNTVLTTIAQPNCELGSHAVPDGSTSELPPDPSTPALTEKSSGSKVKRTRQIRLANDDGGSEDVNPPSKRQRKKARRTRQTRLANDDGGNEDVNPPSKRQRKKAKRTRQTKLANDDGGSEDVNPPPKSQRKKAPREEANGVPRPRSRKRKAAAAAEEDGAAKFTTRKARSPTPEDAENQVVDLQQLKMADLTKDLRIGKKFSRHDELRDRERQARVKARLQKEEGLENGAATDLASPRPDGLTSSIGSDQSSSTAPAATAGPQFRIVDGQIVVDQSSLVLNRHARAAESQAKEGMETVEENDFTRLITSSSFMASSKLKGPNIWSLDETELFYRGLEMFGTEFEMISKIFPGKQRRHIKLKFNREERHNPARIDAVLIGEKTTKMDLDEYRTFTGAEYQPVETIEAEQRKIEEDYEQERQRIADEQAEAMRKKREELFADDNDADAGRQKRPGKRKRRKQAVSYGLNGEPISAADG